MNREEIEAKIAELQAQLDEMNKEVTYGDLKAGDRFEWCGLTFVKLKNDLALLDDLDNVKGKYCIFDPYDNNYNQSLIRQYINGKFLKLNNIDENCLLKVNDIGDIATLLSKEEYDENKDIISRLSCCWWLRSPYAVGSYNAYVVYSGGDVHGYGVHGTDLAVRAAFNLKSDTIVSIIKR